MTRDFDLGDILSITTGKLVSPRHVDGIYDILNYMTGDSLMTHQLPRGMTECQGPLLAQLPQLADIVTPDFHGSKDEVYAWLDTQKAIYGDVLPVAPLAEGEHSFQNPIEELCDMVGPERVIVV